MKKYKKILSVLLSLAMVAGILSAAPLTGFATLSVYDGPFDLGEDESDPDLWAITGAEDENFLEGMLLLVTQEVDGEPVNSVASMSFYACPAAAVEIQGGISSVNEYSFMECPQLVAVKIDDGVVSIGDGCFANCPNLVNVYIPDSVTGIGDEAFEGCSDSLTFFCNDNTAAFEFAEDKGFNVSTPYDFTFEPDFVPPYSILVENAYDLSESYEVPLSSDLDGLVPVYTDSLISVVSADGIVYRTDSDLDVAYSNELFPEEMLDESTGLKAVPGVYSISLFENEDGVSFYADREEMTFSLMDEDDSVIEVYEYGDEAFDIDLPDESYVSLSNSADRCYNIIEWNPEGNQAFLQSDEDYESGDNGMFFLPAGEYQVFIDIDFFGNVTLSFPLEEIGIPDVGVSLTLGGDIGVNTYFNLPDGVDDANITYYYKDEEIPGEVFENTNPGSSAAYGYISTFHVAAKEMTEIIGISLKDQDGYEFFYTETSVCEYAVSVLESPENTFAAQDALVVLVKDMLYYGAQAQLFFNYNTDNLADAGLENYTPADVDTSDWEIYDYSAGSEFGGILSSYGLTYAGSSLVLNGKVALRVFFTTDENYDGTVHVYFSETEEAQLKPRTIGGVDYVYVEFTDIPASELRDPQLIGLIRDGMTDAETVSFNALKYIKGEIGRDSNVSPVVKSLFNFGEATISYFLWRSMMQLG